LLKKKKYIECEMIYFWSGSLLGRKEKKERVRDRESRRERENERLVEFCLN